MFFPTSEESAMVAQPRDGTFDHPAMTIPTQRSSVLGFIFREPVTAVRRNHFDAELGQGIIEGVAVVGLVSDQALGLNFVFIPSEGLLHHVGLGPVGGIEGD